MRALESTTEKPYNMGMWCTTSLAVSLLIVAICVGEPDTKGPLNPDRFPYSQKLDDNYRLQWNFNSTHIIFKVTVKTTGYVGFGLSNHGEMFPSDVIIAWVKDGEVHFNDRHAIGHFLPPIDAHQDWYLVSGSEDGEFTTITMVRLLDTCDDEDMAIDSGTTRVIYSYSPVDPESENDIYYHGNNNRGSRSLLLLDPPADENAKDNLPDDVITIDFLHHNYSIPAYHTDYGSTTFKLPPLEGEYHMVRYEPVIEKANEKLVHHMILYSCESALLDSELGIQFSRYNAKQPGDVDNKCVTMMLGWAVGGMAFDFPPHVGVPVGGAKNAKYFMLETHFDNPLWKAGVLDSSGFRLFLTKKLRQHDAGIMATGVNVDTYQIIPPHYNDFMSRGMCSKGCIERALGNTEIHLFANLLHSHLIGSKMVTRHIRNGTELTPIMEDNNYDFNYQEMRLLETERTVRKDDTIITDCHYDSSRKVNITYGGLPTSSEMCLSTLYYYPRSSLEFCQSRTDYDSSSNSQGSIFDRIRDMDFTNKTVRDEFVDITKDSDMTYLCILDGKFEFGRFEKPKYHPYVKQNKCKKG